MTAGTPRHGLAGMLAALALLSACGQPSGPTPTPKEFIEFNSGGLVFVYPSGWTRFQYEMVNSFTRLIGYLATVPVRDPCTRTANTVSCTDESYELTPGTLVVEILSEGGARDLDLTLMPLTISGMPASFRIEPSGADRRRLEWEIAISSSSAFRITANLRGPGLDAMQAQVESMVDGLQFNPPVARLPDDADQRATGAQRALAAALRVLRPDLSEVGCFAPVPGATRKTTVVISGSPELRGPVPVTCTSRVTASRLQLWEVVLTIDLEEPTANLGRIEITQWVTPNGEPTSMTETSGP